MILRTDVHDGMGALIRPVWAGEEGRRGGGAFAGGGNADGEAEALGLSEEDAVSDREDAAMELLKEEDAVSDGAEGEATG